MEVIPNWSKSSKTVFAISWPATAEQVSAFPKTYIYILDEGMLVVEELNDCEIVDGNVSQFTFLPTSFDYGRTHSLMWKPLADAGIWEQIIDRDPEAISVFSEMRRDAGLNSLEKI